MKSVKSVMFAATTMVAACYGAAPPRPPQVPLPAQVPGGEIAVASDTKTAFEQVEKEAKTCPAGAGQCVVTRYTETEPVTRTTTRASYAGAPINYGQFRTMTDPSYDAKLATLADLSRRCERANVPRYLGMGLVVAGLVAGAAVSGDAGPTIMYAGVGAGAASYGLGYLAFGGRDCATAATLYRELDMTQAMQYDTVEGARRAAEMQALAEQFNAAIRATAASAAAPSGSAAP